MVRTHLHSRSLHPSPLLTHPPRLIEAWAVAAYNPLLCIRASPAGPRLYALAEVRKLIHLDGVEALQIVIQGADPESLGISDAHINFAERQTPIWVGPMRMVQLACEYSANTEWRVNKGIGGSKPTPPSLHGCSAQRLKTLRNVLPNSLISVWFGPDYEDNW